ncbi:MAG: hypothetical protein Q7S81_02395 [bacterium]|nr:hypothetical protein [bacterium]
MEKIYNSTKQFICDEHRKFKFRIGNILASGLSGFIAGVVFASIFWVMVILFLKYFPIIFQSNPGL